MIPWYGTPVDPFDDLPRADSVDKGGRIRVIQRKNASRDLDALPAGQSTVLDSKGVDLVHGRNVVCLMPYLVAYTPV